MVLSIEEIANRYDKGNIVEVNKKRIDIDDNLKRNFPQLSYDWRLYESLRRTKQYFKEHNYKVTGD
jgi:hypothetical protein